MAGEWLFSIDVVSISRYAYNLANNKWSSLNIQVKKKRGGNKTKRKAIVQPVAEDKTDPDGDVVMESAPPDEGNGSESENDDDEGEDNRNVAAMTQKLAATTAMEVDQAVASDAEDPSRPVSLLTRYSTMLAVLKNTLYM